MNQWRPIREAPAGALVEVGRWEPEGDDGLVWRRSVGVAMETMDGGVFGSFNVTTDFGAEYSHFRRLPGPPNSPEEATDA